MSAYPVIGVGDVHGGDAQEVNERGIIAASAQSPHTMGRNMVRLQGAGPAHQPGVPIPVPGSPGDQAVHGAATVVISDPIVIDAETAGARCGDLSGGESSLPLAPPQVQQPGRSSAPALAQSFRFFKALPAASVPPPAPLRSISSAYPV